MLTLASVFMNNLAPQVQWQRKWFLHPPPPPTLYSLKLLVYGLKPFWF